MCCPLNGSRVHSEVWAGHMYSVASTLDETPQIEECPSASGTPMRRLGVSGVNDKVATPLVLIARIFHRSTGSKLLASRPLSSSSSSSSSLTPLASNLISHQRQDTKISRYLSKHSSPLSETLTCQSQRFSSVSRPRALSESPKIRDLRPMSQRITKRMCRQGIL